MKMNGNTILITGGTSGLGMGLAEALHKLGNKVIITGRREDRLKSICAANPGMSSYVLDVANPESVRSVAKKATHEHPSLNCVFNNAGVQNRFDFTADQPFDDNGLLQELGINIAGVVRMSAEFLPHLRKQKDAVILNVSSGLAFVPLARYPVYCATKAAVHSFSMSLRHQLKNSGIRVLELIPPYVATELGGPSKPPAGAPQPMPLDAFVRETMEKLATDADEIAIGPAQGLQAAATTEAAKGAFAGMNR